MDLSTDFNSQENDCLRELKGLIKEDNQLKNLNLEDRFLLHFVRGRKYNVPKSFDTLRNYIYTRREKYAEYFRNIDPKACRALAQRVIRVFGDSDQSDRRIGITRIKWWDPDELTFDDVLEAGVLFFEEAWNDKSIETNGFVGILDCEGFSFKHFKHCSLPKLIKLHELVWNAFPIRFKALHIVNEPVYFKMVYALCYPFIPTKLRSRTHFHGKRQEELHKNLPQSTLLTFLGGPYHEDDEDIWDLEFERRILSRGVQ